MKHETKRITRARLILQMARRARTVADIGGVNRAVGSAVKLADTHDEFDILQAAQKIIRTKMDGWKSSRVVDIKRPGELNA